MSTFILSTILKCRILKCRLLKCRTFFYIKKHYFLTVFLAIFWHNFTIFNQKLTIFTITITIMPIYVKLRIQATNCDSFLCETGLCELFPTTSTFVRQWIVRQLFCATVFSTTSTIVRNTVVRQFFQRQARLCDSFLCDSTFVRQVFCANGELRRKRRLTNFYDFL